MRKYLRYVLFIVLTVCFFSPIDVFALGNTEKSADTKSKGNKNRSKGNNYRSIVTIKPSSQGPVYVVDYKPRGFRFRIEAVHSISVKIHDYLDNSISEIYYLKEEDKTARKKLFNIILPQEVFTPYTDLTLTIDYFDEENRILGVKTESFYYEPQLVFKDIQPGQMENVDTKASYKVSNRILSSYLTEQIKIGRANFNTGENLFSKVAAELLSIGNQSGTYILLEEVFYSQNVESIRKSSKRYEELTEYAQTFENYLEHNFRKTTEDSVVQNSYHVYTTLTNNYRTINENSKESLSAPFFRIYLFENEADLKVLQKFLLDITIRTYRDIFDEYIKSKTTDPNGDTLFDLLRQNFQQVEESTASYEKFLQKNNRYIMEIDSYKKAFDGQKERVANWFEEKWPQKQVVLKQQKLLKNRLIEVKRLKAERIKSIQAAEFENSSNKAARNFSSILIQELAKLSDEQKQIEEKIEEQNQKFLQFEKETLSRINRFNDSQNEFSIQKDGVNTTEFMDYELFFHNEQKISQEVLDQLSKQNKISTSVLEIYKNQLKVLETNMLLLEAFDPYGDAEYDSVQDFINALELLDVNYEKFNTIMVDLVNEVLSEMSQIDFFDNVKEDYTPFVSDSILDSVHRLLDINTTLDDALYTIFNSDKLFKERSTPNKIPVLQDLYLGVDSLPDIQNELIPLVNALLNADMDILKNSIVQEEQAVLPPVVQEEQAVLPNKKFVEEVPPSSLDNQYESETKTIWEPETFDRYGILSSRSLSANQIKSLTNYAHLKTGLTINWLHSLFEQYNTYSALEGVNPIVAIAQFIFHVDNRDRRKLMLKNNNPGILGDSNVKGWRMASFISIENGVIAHVQHIKAYASYQKPAAPIIDPRYQILLKENIVGTRPTLPLLIEGWYVGRVRTKAKKDLYQIINVMSEF